VSKEYSLWRVGAVLLIVMAAGSFVTSWWLRRPFVGAERLAAFTAHRAVRAGLGLLIVLTVVAGARGSAGHRPVRVRDAAVTADPFLNKVVLNPYSALRYAWKNHQDLRSTRGLKKFLPGGDVRAAARLLATHEEPLETVADAFLQVTKGPRGIPPRHIFVVAIESFDSWPLLDKFASLHLADRAKELARKGIWVKSFVSGSGGSMSSFSALVTGLGDTGLVTNLQASSRDVYETSLPDLFRRLGYRTRFFYAGSESRHRIGDFSREQGFEDILCGGTIGGMDGNEWGVNDADLFQFVLDTVDDERPSFNFILTASNHPPYDIDVYEEGFPLREIPAELEDDFSRGNHELVTLGHHWYSDRSAGGFVDELERRLPRVLVAITGDHWSRRFPGPRPGLYERTSVPLILYGPEVLEGVPVPDELAGSHLDLGATLIELAAPAGFLYHSTGHNILDPEAQPVGFGRRVIIGPDFILLPEKQAPLLSIPGTPFTPEQDPAALLARHQAIYGLSWWRIKNGEALPTGSKP
jgi:phosphoglycerol transferase MdoB-like AlkP superfamily enzyme